MGRPIKNPKPKRDLEADAQAALELARAMLPGPARTEAMKRAGILRNAADLQRLFSAKRGATAEKGERTSGRRTMIADSFNSRTLANMEVALDRACGLLHSGAEQHKTRRYIASRILDRARQGDVTP